MNKAFIQPVTNGEEWKDIAGYEGLYKISNYGRVKSLCGFNGHKYIERERILTPCKQKTNAYYGRAVVNLHKGKSQKTYKVHRLVANAFIDNPHKYKVVNHKDGNPLNNHYLNLEWCTQKHNVQHAIQNELRIYRINTIDKETMLDLLNSGRTYDEISELLGIAKGTVFNYIKKFRIKKYYK